MARKKAQTQTPEIETPEPEVEIETPEPEVEIKHSHFPTLDYFLQSVENEPGLENTSRYILCPRRCTREIQRGESQFSTIGYNNSREAWEAMQAGDLPKNITRDWLQKSAAIIAGDLAEMQESRRRFFDDGDEICIDRYLSGDDEYWITRQNNEQAAEIVKIAIAFDLSANTGTEAILPAFREALRIAARCEENGIEAEINIGCYTEKYGQHSVTTHTIKQVYEKMNLQHLASRLNPVMRDFFVQMVGYGQYLQYGCCFSGYGAPQTAAQLRRELFKLGYHYVIDRAGNVLYRYNTKAL